VIKDEEASGAKENVTIDISRDYANEESVQLNPIMTKEGKDQSVREDNSEEIVPFNPAL
jgi:hypothetical protein